MYCKKILYLNGRDVVNLHISENANLRMSCLCFHGSVILTCAALFAFLQKQHTGSVNLFFVFLKNFQMVAGFVLKEETKVFCSLDLLIFLKCLRLQSKTQTETFSFLALWNFSVYKKGLNGPILINCTALILMNWNLLASLSFQLIFISIPFGLLSFLQHTSSLS